MTKTITISVSEELRERMHQYPKINFSKVFQDAITEKMDVYDQNLSKISSLEQKKASLTEALCDIDSKLEEFK